MVLENILSPTTAREKPYYMGIIAFLFTIVGLWLAYYLFPNSASILTLAFIVIAAEPIIRSTFQQAEEEEADRPGKATTFLERHFDLVKIYSWFFLGLVLAFATWYIILPENAQGNCALGDICKQLPSRGSIYEEQESQLRGIGELRSQLQNESVATGNVIATGNAIGGNTDTASATTKDRDFWSIVGFLFSNNATVLLLAILFSFLFGEGALFLISWNASIIGTVIGKISAQTLATLPVHDITSIVYSLGVGVYQGIGFIPHGIPEIVAYYIGAIAGGIISVSMAKEVYKTHEFETIAKDAGALIVIAVVVLFIAALIEGYLWLYT